MIRKPISRFATLSLAIALTMTTAACSSGSTDAKDDSGPIRVGAIYDETGPLNIFGQRKINATKLAIKQINSEGGVNGRKLDLVLYDAQSRGDLYSQYAERLTLKDKVAVMMGATTSDHREAIRPIASRNKTLYFYNEQYEGGVCDKNMFATGLTPSQQLDIFIKKTIEHHGKNLYVISADYLYGQINEKWVKELAKKHGGQVVGSELIPLDVSNFGRAIARIQSTNPKPDAIVSFLVGSENAAFYGQRVSADIGDIPVVSTSFGVGDEQSVLDPPEYEGIEVALGYFEEIESPANAEFLKLWKAEYGDASIGSQAMDEWNAWHLWKAAVENAGSTDRDKVLSALESGDITFDGPGGKVTVDGPSHHVTKDMHIGVANSKGGFDITESFAQLPPTFEQSKCDLKKKPTTNEQFFPAS